MVQCAALIAPYGFGDSAVVKDIDRKGMFTLLRQPRPEGRRLRQHHLRQHPAPAEETAGAVQIARRFVWLALLVNLEHLDPLGLSHRGGDPFLHCR